MRFTTASLACLALFTSSVLAGPAVPEIDEGILLRTDIRLLDAFLACIETSQGTIIRTWLATYVQSLITDHPHYY
jgi:hypothetical protein